MITGWYRRNRSFQGVTLLWLLTGLLVGCHARNDTAIQHITENYYPRPSLQDERVSMGAGDVLGWHLVADEPKSIWVTRPTDGSPSGVHRLNTDPFVRHGVVGAHGSATDPLTH